MLLLLRLWESLDLELVPDLCPLLIGDVTHHQEAIRSAGAEALSSAVSQYQDQSAPVLGQLTELYHQKLYVRRRSIARAAALSHAQGAWPQVLMLLSPHRDPLRCWTPWAGSSLNPRPTSGRPGELQCQSA